MFCKTARRKWRSAGGPMMLFVAACMLAGCGRHVDKIGDLNGNPNKYLHREVAIVGIVTRVYAPPLGITDWAIYQVDDGTGHIWVVGHNGAPERQDKVGVQGRLEPVTNLNLGILGNPFGNVIEEQQRRSE